MYTPLMFAKNLDIELIPDKSGWKNVLRDCMDEPEKIIEFLWASKGLLDPDYRGECERLNNALLRHRNELYRTMTGSTEIPKRKDQDEAFSQESISMFLVDNLWGRDKEVYRFDAEMELALADCEDVRLPVRILDRLPYNCFYLEFADDGIFKSNFDGAFVYVCPCSKGYVIVFQRVKEDGRSMFGHTSLFPDDPNGTFLFTKEDIMRENGLDRNKDWFEFAHFALNALLYLCAENSDIRESESTKKTYHPGAIIKHAFREVRKWECEYRIACDGKHQNYDNNDDEAMETASGKRRSPVPHTRRAHWHHYWTGKGRSVLSLRWIVPKRIGGDGPATVHKRNL